MNSDNIYSTGHIWSRETMARDAAGFAAAEAQQADTFDQLARAMGYKPNLLHVAIGRTTTRKAILRRLNDAGVRYHNADEQLADAYLRDLGQEAARLMAAE